MVQTYLTLTPSNVATGYERRDFDKEESNQFMSKIKNNYNMYKTEGYVSFEGNDHFPGFGKIRKSANNLLF